MSQRSAYHFGGKRKPAKITQTPQNEAVQPKAPTFVGNDKLTTMVKLMYEHRDKLIVDLPSEVQKEFDRLMKFISGTFQLRDDTYKSAVALIDSYFGDTKFPHLTVGSVFSRGTYPLDRYPDCAEMCLLKISREGRKVCPYSIGSLNKHGNVRLILSTVEEHKTRVIIFVDQGQKLSEQNIAYLKQQGFRQVELVVRTTNGYNYITKGFTNFEDLNNVSNTTIIAIIIGFLIFILLVLALIYFFRKK